MITLCKNKTITIMIALFVMLFLTGCEQKYERLETLSSASEIKIDGNAYNIMPLLQEIFNKDRIENICYEEYINMSFDFTYMHDDVIYTVDYSDDCDSPSQKNNIQAFTRIEDYKIDVLFYYKEKASDDSNFEVSSDIGRLKVVYYYQNISNTIFIKYDKDAKYFTCEEAQFANYIYDNFLEIKE